MSIFEIGDQVVTVEYGHEATVCATYADGTVDVEWPSSTKDRRDITHSLEPWELDLASESRKTFPF